MVCHHTIVLQLTSLKILHRRLPMSRIWPASKSPKSYSDHVKTPFLPEIHIQDRLLDLYFTYVHPMFPVLHKSGFLAQYNSQFVFLLSTQPITLTDEAQETEVCLPYIPFALTLTMEQRLKSTIYVSATKARLPSSRVLPRSYTITTFLYFCDHGSIL